MLSDARQRRLLDLAAKLALRGFGRVEPNPMVGCVLCDDDGNVLGMGHHRRFGGPHAEAQALTDARSRGVDVRGATALVTLEPCAHTGKQPPCTIALIEAGVARVLYARSDPNPLATGGAQVLRAAGVEASLTRVSPLASSLSDPFVKRVTTGLPWVIAKWAQTVDGRIATRTGESKWISGELARLRVHRLRSRVDAILTGIGTVLADDPLLTARLGRPPSRVAARVVADTGLDLPLDSQLARTARQAPTLVACERSMACTSVTAKKRAACDQLGVEIIPVADQGIGRGLNLAELLRILARDHGVSTVLVEAGPGLLGSLFEEGLIDEAIVYIAPMLMGDEQARSVAMGRVVEKLSSARRLRLVHARRVGDDVEVIYRREPAEPWQ